MKNSFCELAWDDMREISPVLLSGFESGRTGDLRELPRVPLRGEGSCGGVKLKFQSFGHLMRRTDSFEKTLILGKIEDGRRRGYPLGACLCSRLQLLGEAPRPVCLGSCSS